MRIYLYIDEEVLAKVEDYRFKHRKTTRNSAIIELLERALKDESKNESHS